MTSSSNFTKVRRAKSFQQHLEEEGIVEVMGENGRFVAFQTVVDAMGFEDETAKNPAGSPIS